MRKNNVKFDDVDRFVIDALFSTVTNVNFDAERLDRLLQKGHEIKTKVKKAYLGG